ncbi:hypothetical protein CSA37_06275 [Candidatus Fermentibacteria bacterium]|nr:MAG: hypothetical protein CSA37_06275 [Candidatus Fermentibacteria bacterium]
MAPIPAVCWVILVTSGAAASVVATAGILLTGLLFNWKNKTVRNLFLSYLPSVIFILLVGTETNPALIISGGAALQIAFISTQEQFRKKTAQILFAGWLINAVEAWTLLFFYGEDGIPGAFVMLSIMLLFTTVASEKGRQLVSFTGEIGTLSLQNRLISHLYQNRNPYTLYFFDGNKVWTMQGRLASKVPDPAMLKKKPDNRWKVFPVGASSFLASGKAAEEMSALRGSELRETLLLLESIWRASFARVRMENAFLGVAAILVKIADRKDSETHRHSIRVARTAYRLGEKMGLPEEELLQLKVGAMLHDIGKLAIPGSILRKKKLLTEKERKIIETHPVAGARLLAPMERYGHVSSIVLQHHERIDGSGYPYGLRGAEISLHARIVAVADTFDAILSTRSYHMGKPVHMAIREISRHSGTHFDSRVVQALEEMVQ